MPFGEAAIIALDSSKKIGLKVDKHLTEIRKKKSKEKENGHWLDWKKETYLTDIVSTRFSNGEGKISLQETVRGKDIYILSDIGNYGCTYNMFGMDINMSPDEHFQDIKRAISAISGNARRINVIMPLLYASRQHKRKSRESLDCATALQEIAAMGVKNIITFDAHDPRVENAIPLTGFENLHTTFEMIKALLETEKDLRGDRDSMMVISPDTGAMDRAIYYASVMGLDVGLFYKRRDPNKVVNGKNPIIQHEYMGGDVSGKDVIIVDDMIASGDSILDLAYELKDRNARNIYAAVTFALFTEGAEKMRECWEKGLITRCFSTNLTYIPKKIRDSEWFAEVDMSEYLATLIDKLNYDESISFLFDATERLESFVKSSKDFDIF